MGGSTCDPSGVKFSSATLGLCCALACACGEGEPADDDLRLEDDGLVFAFGLDPEAPRVGVHVLHLTLTDNRGAPATEAEVLATPWMPAHGHGAPNDPVVSSEGNGLFRIEPIDFFMPGRWEVRVVARVGDIEAEVAPAWDVR